MSRSRKKGPFVDAKLAAKVGRSVQSGSREAIRTWSRSCTIVPDFVGVTFEVHNGRKFTKVFVVEDMVGHKLGEFAPTTQFRLHGGASSKVAARRDQAPRR